MKTRNLSVSLLIIAFSVFLISCTANRDDLIEKLNAQIRQENFDDLYEQSSDLLHLNVSKEQFIQRMKIAIAKLKTIDENLNFKRRKEREKLLDEINEGVLITAIQEVGEGDKSVTVMFSWDKNGKFNDLSVHWYSETLKESQALSILYKE